MNKDRFAQLAEIYGAELRRWPAAHRNGAQAFVNADPNPANAILNDARITDALLNAAPDQAASSALMGRILADAPTASANSLSRWLSHVGSGLAFRAGLAGAAFALLVGAGFGHWSMQWDQQRSAGETLLNAALSEQVDDLSYDG